MRKQGEFTKKELYELQSESDAIAFSDAIGTVVEVSKWFISDRDIAYVFGTDGKVFATTSKTVKDKLSTADDLGLLVNKLTIRQKKCKNGQGRYITCECEVIDNNE